MRLVLVRCREEGIILSKKNLEMGSTLTFTDFMISCEGGEGVRILPDPSKLDVIRKAAAPENITELRSFLGACNQMLGWSPDYSHSTSMKRGLLKDNNCLAMD